MNTFTVSTSKLELKTEDGKDYVVGYISTSDKDLVNDIVTKGCLRSMAHQMKERNIKFDLEHETLRGDSRKEKEINKTLIPIAKVDKFGLDENGLMVKALLNQHNSRFDAVKGMVKDGFLDAFSIAFIPTKSRIVEHDGEEIRMLDDMNLLNVALTGTPVNPKAQFTEVVAKSLDAIKPSQEEIMTEKDLEKKVEAKDEVLAKIEELSTTVKSLTEWKKTFVEKEEPDEKPDEKPETEEKVNPKEIKALKDEIEVQKKELEKMKNLPEYKGLLTNVKDTEEKAEESLIGLPTL